MVVKTLFQKATRIGPLALGAIALVVLMLGVYLQIGENARAAQGEAVGIAGMTIFGLLSKIACGIGVLAIAKMVFGGAADAPPAEMDMPLPPPIPSAAERDAIVAQSQPARAAPLWKQRSGLAPVAESIPQPDPVIETSFEPTEARPRRSFGLRKVLIGIVGALFAVALIATVVDMIEFAPEQSAVNVTTAQDLRAATVADRIVPDADPNRSWTDIDVTPVVEWFVAKFYLAVSGDVDAQMTLGMIVGGTLFALFMIRFYFRLRRAMQPRTSPRIGSMGLN